MGERPMAVHFFLYIYEEYAGYSLYPLYPKSPHSFSLYFKKISAIKWEVAVIFKVWPQNQHYLETC